MNPPTVVFLPGIGADRRLFDHLAPAFPGSFSPEWIAPEPDEPLRRYAVRWSATWPEGRWLIVGFSFGGQVALELLREPAIRERVAGLVLVAACRDGRAIDYFRRRARWASHLPDFALRAGMDAQRRRFVRREGLSPDDAARLSAMQADHDLARLRWSVARCADWDHPGPGALAPDLPVRQVHGGLDDTIPAHPGHPIDLWSDAGHLLTFTHAERLAGVIREVQSAVD